MERKLTINSTESPETWTRNFCVCVCVCGPNSLLVSWSELSPAGRRPLPGSASVRLADIPECLAGRPYCENKNILSLSTPPSSRWWAASLGCQEEWDVPQVLGPFLRLAVTHRPLTGRDALSQSFTLFFNGGFVLSLWPWSHWIRAVLERVVRRDPLYETSAAFCHQAKWKTALGYIKK